MILDFNLDLNAGGKFDAHQRIHNFLGRFDDVDQSLVSAILELLTAILVLVHCAEDRDDLLLSGKRDRTGNLIAGMLHEPLARAVTTNASEERT